MTRVLRVVVVLLGALVVGALHLDVPTADAQELVRAGWWNRANQGDLDLSAVPPSPPPDGGVAVGATPEGAIAIGALRFTLDGEDASPVLTLGVDATSTNAGADGIAILACMSGAAWSAGGGQAWDTAPPAVCSAADGGASVLGQRSEDGTTWAFALETLRLETEIDVVLVPATAEGAPAVAPYQLNFAAPTAASLTTASSAAPASGSPAVPAPTDGNANVGGGSAPATRGASFAATGALPTNAFAPALPESAQQFTPTAPAVRLGAVPATTASVVPRETAWWVRLLAVLLTLAACAALYNELRRDDDVPEMRGVGGLVAVRSGPPPGL